MDPWLVVVAVYFAAAMAVGGLTAVFAEAEGLSPSTWRVLLVAVLWPLIAVYVLVRGTLEYRRGKNIESRT